MRPRKGDVEAQLWTTVVRHMETCVEWRVEWMGKHRRESLGKREFLEDNTCWDVRRAMSRGGEGGEVKIWTPNSATSQLCDLGKASQSLNFLIIRQLH